MRRAQSSTPSTLAVAGLAEVPSTTPFSESVRRRRTLKIFTPSFAHPGMRAEKLLRAASSSAIEGPGLFLLPTVVLNGGFGFGTAGFKTDVKRPDQSGSSGQLDNREDCEEDQQQELSAACKAWADDEVSCFKASAKLFTDEEAGSNISRLVSVCSQIISSSFDTAACCTPAVGSSDSATPMRQLSQAATAAVFALTRSGSSKDSSSAVGGKRVFEQPVAAVDKMTGPASKVPSPRGRLRRVRRVVRDLDRLDEP